MGIVINGLTALTTIQVNIERFTSLMETESNVSDTPAVIEKYGDTFHPRRENWEELHGDVEFKDVSFHYPDGEETVLNHFNLKVNRGETVAIVGETGAGKSTLVNLVCRFFEPTEGRVLIDGRDARERSQLWLHSALGYVLQTPHLFSGTIRENLRMGRLNATEEEMLAVLDRTASRSFVENLPNGLDTVIGEKGYGLSEGQAQRLAIARALIRNAPIILLDEATSALDEETELMVLKGLEETKERPTCLVITHRRSVLKYCDRELLIKDRSLSCNSEGNK